MAAGGQDGVARSSSSFADQAAGTKEGRKDEKVKQVKGIRMDDGVSPFRCFYE